MKYFDIWDLTQLLTANCNGNCFLLRNRCKNRCFRTLRRNIFFLPWNQRICSDKEACLGNTFYYLSAQTSLRSTIQWSVRAVNRVRFHILHELFKLSLAPLSKSKHITQPLNQKFIAHILRSHQFQEQASTSSCNSAQTWTLDRYWKWVFCISWMATIKTMLVWKGQGKRKTPLLEKNTYLTMKRRLRYERNTKTKLLSALNALERFRTEGIWTNTYVCLTFRPYKRNRDVLLIEKVFTMIRWGQSTSTVQPTSVLSARQPLISPMAWDVMYLWYTTYVYK